MLSIRAKTLDRRLIRLRLFWLPVSLLQFRRVWRVIWRSTAELVVFHHRLNNILLAVGNKLELQTDVEVFRAEIFVTPGDARGQSHAWDTDRRQFGQLD